jgi:MFS family permease
MKAVRRLGSVFVAFLAGAVLATGLTILTALLLDGERPPRFGLVIASGTAVVIGSVFLGWLAVIVGDLEALERAEHQQTARDAVWSREARRIGALTTIGVVATLGGVGLLPLRLLVVGWPASHPAQTPAGDEHQTAPASPSAHSTSPGAK